MKKRKDDKTKAGQHRGLTQTGQMVRVPATTRTPEYNAHVYQCPCGAKNTRRELNKLMCPIAVAKRKAAEEALTARREAQVSNRLAKQSGQLLRVNPEQ